MTDLATTPPVVAPVTPDAGQERPFTTLMCVEGRWTGDERIVMVDALSWDGLLPFLLTDGHGAELDDIQGWITEIERVPGMTADERFIIGRGVFYTKSRAGADIVQLLTDGAPVGVSVDLDAMEEGGIDPADPAADENAWYMVVEKARIRSLATCVIPAFAEALITLGEVEATTTVPAIDGPTPLPADEVPQEEGGGIEEIIVAGGYTIELPEVPPAAWFAEPTDVTIMGALTVTNEGRFYGLLAPAGVLHSGRPDATYVPMGTVNYGEFMRGETPTIDGGRVVTGNITMGCGHGDGRELNAGPVRAHYDNTCSIVATCAVGERTAAPAGVWVAGALLPGITADQVRRMMACQLSGHWLPSKQPGYTHDLLAALLVPVPGFAIARSGPSITYRDGALAASAIPVRFENDCGCDEADPDCGCAEAEQAQLVDSLIASLRSDFGERLARLESALDGLAPVRRELLRARMNGGGSIIT